MASITAVARNVDKVREGEWRRLFLDADPEQDGWILTRGVDDAYRDALNVRMASAAKAYNGKVNLVPTRLLRKIDIDLCVDRLFLDVRNVQGPDDQDLSFDQFCAALYQPEYQKLFDLAQAAAMSVGEDLEEQKKEAEKN